MESKAKVLGHPIHPILIVFPLGLLATSVGFDIGYFTTGNPEFAVVSFWLISIGILGGFVAAIPGAIDWWVIPSQTRAKAIGLWHGGGNVVVLLLFIASCWLRSQRSGYAPSSTAVTLSCIAVLIALITGWLGGELVDRLGVGVDNGAHLNAPNSLLGKPANYNMAAPEISGHKPGRK